MAITGVKNFTAGAVLTASDVNQYLSRGVFVFASAAARTSAFSAAGITLSEGWFSYLTDTNSTEYYDGAAWVPLAAANAISTVASASSIAVTAPGTYLLTGTTSVATITGGTTGMTITVQASGQASGVPVVLTYGTGANAIKLAAGRSLGIYAQVPADTGAGAGESVTLRYDGTAWVEIARDLRTVLSYTQVTTPVTISGGSGSETTCIGPSSAITFDGVTPIEMETYAYWQTGATAGSNMLPSFWFNATQIGVLGIVGTATGGNDIRVPSALKRSYTPTAVSQTFSVKAYRNTSDAMMNAGTGIAGAVVPAYLKISRSV